MNRQILNLEDELGAALFDRRHDGVRPPAGQKPYDVHLCGRRKGLDQMGRLARSGQHHPAAKMKRSESRRKFPLVQAELTQFSAARDMRCRFSARFRRYAFLATLEASE